MARIACAPKTPQEFGPTHVVFGKAMFSDQNARSFNSGGIRDLTPLRQFTSLETLDLSNNPINEIGPLRNLKKLKRLDLSNTFVQDLSPLHEHPELLYLNVKATRVSEIRGLPASLRLLQVDRTLPDGELARFRKSHPECEIQFDDGVDRPPGEVGPIGDARKVLY